MSGIPLVVHTMSQTLRPFFRHPAPCWTQVRCLATPSSVTPPKTNSGFSRQLDNGPSLDDFISGEPVQRVVLGNTKGQAYHNRLRAM